MVLLYIEASVERLPIIKNIVSLLPENTEVVFDAFLFGSAISKKQYSFVICIVESHLINQYIIDLYKNNQLFAKASFFHVKKLSIETYYITKSINQKDIVKVVVYEYRNINLQELILAQVYPKSESILVREKTGNWSSIDHRNILCVESKSTHLLVHTLHGGTHEINISQRKLMENLPSNFARVHRSFFVNKNHVCDVTKGFLQLVNGFRIPFSKTFSKQFEEFNTFAMKS